MLSLKEIRPILKEYNIRPSKKLGQNFLIDKNIQRKIVDVLEAGKEDTFLEIGPGLGALTEELCKRAKKVIAIEKDRRLFDFLKKNVFFSNLELIQGDILEYNFNNKSRIKVIGNLPYYISSPILTKLLDNRDFISSINIAVQKEFAERLVATPRTKTYGSISCFIQFYTEPNILFPIKRNAFYPAPEVDSCFLKIQVRDKSLFPTDEEKLFRIIRLCFGKRRKTVLNSLYSSGEFASKEEILQKLERANISPTRRPETILLQEFVKLTSQFSKQG